MNTPWHGIRRVAAGIMLVAAFGLHDVAEAGGQSAGSAPCGSAGGGQPTQADGSVHRHGDVQAGTPADAHRHDAGAAPSNATKDYKTAMDAMHGPMMQAIEDSDPDVAFVKGMIPHHQGAIDMARIVLRHGKDEQVKKWAADVIREQQREIDAMAKWLEARCK